MNTLTNNSPEYLTTGQAATLCSVTPDAVLKWIKAGKLRAHRTPGGHFRISRSEFNSLLLPKEEAHPEIKVDNPVIYCWEYYSRKGEIGESCLNCIVYNTRALRCFEMALLPTETGHAMKFCTSTCDECEYYHLVRGQKPNVLVVADRPDLQDTLNPSDKTLEFNLRFTECEYKCSMLVENYRPDFVVLDCSMGAIRAGDFAKQLNADPRIPYIRVVLAGSKEDFPAECDKEVFARVERPFTFEVFEDLFSSLKRAELPVNINGVERAS